MISVEIMKERTSMELLEKVLDDNNLYEAYKQVYRNKGTSGIYGISVGELVWEYQFIEQYSMRD